MELPVLVLAFAARELALFAAVGIVLGGVGDVAVDLIWLFRTGWRRMTVYRRHARASADTLAPPRAPGTIVIFIAAWDEGDVIGAMLTHACRVLCDGDWRIYVGTYPNDPLTIAAVSPHLQARVRMVTGTKPGPTTKADCLNTLWHALLHDEVAEGWCAKAVVLHDAEDVIHPAEVRIYDKLIEQFALVQLPVLPLPNPQSRWVAGHYLDEFAESHGKALVVREAIGAAIPAAGVGCAFARDTLAAIAADRGGVPFDDASLTEDYELGLGVARLGATAAFVRLPVRKGAAPVAVRAHFPANLDAAVRQKARWITGIALSGWDRLGWEGGVAESWMRLHDRRALLAAIVLFAAYVALVLGALAQLAVQFWPVAVPPVGSVLAILLILASGHMVWRLVFRFGFVTASYGWREGLRALPRAVLANIIAMMAARRALFQYLRMRHTGVVRWDKTAHHFPAFVPAE